MQIIWGYMTLPNKTESSTQKILIAGETSISVNIANDLSNSSYEIIFVSESIDTLQKLPETKISEGHIKAINTDITDINSFEKYIEEDLFKNQNIKLEFQNYSSVSYQQKNVESFIPELSILDLLFNCGKDSQRIIRNV